MLATCLGCGQPVATTAAFCIGCGRPVRRACSNCGAVLLGPEARFCATCGAAVGLVSAVPAARIAAQPTSPMLPFGTAPQHRSGANLPVILALVAVLAVVAGGFVVLHPGSGSSDMGPIVDGFADPLALAMPVSPAGSLPPVSETKPATGHLTLGAESPLATQTIGATGGTISAQGLQIQVPDGTVAAATNFDVKQAPITGSTFGSFVTPITPLYLIDDGDAVFDKPVTVVLPATIPAGATAMAFSYEDGTGMLTPLMPISQDATTLTVAATHFSPVFGGLVDVADESAPVDSGFRPGTDDWQFTNYGSYVAHSGICEGMNLSAVWYYVNQRRANNAPPLHGPSDNNGTTPRTPDFWQDDSNAYRFASSIQASAIGNWPMYRYLFNFKGIGDGRANYEAVRAAIKATGQPQLMNIDTDARDAAHSLIVVEVEATRLLVSDPNYPGPLSNPRWIPYDPATGKLGPYSSGKSSADIAANGARVYTRFAYMPRATAAADATVSALWAEFQSKTAGDSVFPKYDLEALAATDQQGHDVWAPLVDGYRTSADKLTVRLKDPRPQNADRVRMTIYPGISSTPAAPAGARVTIDLKEGQNPLGILEQGLYSYVDHVDSVPKSAWSYVNFLRLTVVRGPAASATPSAAAAGGSWVLTSATPHGGPNASSYTKPEETYTINSSNGQITFLFDYNHDGSDGKLHRHEEASVSWGPPPASAAPGATWTSTLSAQGTCSFDIDSQGWGVGVSVAALWTAAGEKTTQQWSAGADCQKGSGSTELSWTIPVHDQYSGETFEIDISGSDENGGDSWTYIYQWKP